MEGNKRGVRSSRMRKEVVVCVQDVVGKKKLPVQFEYGLKIDMSYNSLSYLCLKEEVCLDIEEPISYLPPKE